MKEKSNPKAQSPGTFRHTVIIKRGHWRACNSIPSSKKKTETSFKTFMTSQRESRVQKCTASLSGGRRYMGSALTGRNILSLTLFRISGAWRSWKGKFYLAVLLLFLKALLILRLLTAWTLGHTAITGRFSFHRFFLSLGVLGKMLRVARPGRQKQLPGELIVYPQTSDS